MRRIFFFLGSILALAAALLPALASQAPETQPAQTQPTRTDFARKVQPLLKQYCLTCHSGNSPKGGLYLDFKSDNEVMQSVINDRPEWEEIARRIQAQEMPPKGKAQPTSAEKDILLNWLQRDLLALDCGGQRDPGRVTLRRLNKSEYNNTIRDLLFVDGFKPADDFPADDAGYGFDNNGDTLSLSPLLIEQYLKAADQSIQLLLKDRQARNKLFVAVKDFKETFYNRQTRARLILQSVLPRIYRRPVTADQIDRLMQFVRMSFAQDGEDSSRAVALAIRAALVSPRFLFHLEGGVDDSLAAGSVAPVDEYELASRLSYFLWSSMPDDELFTLARDHKLRENLIPQVRRMLKDPKARALTENFAGQWLELRGLKDHSVDTKIYPGYDPQLGAAMLEETQRFFLTIVSEDRSILDFLDTDFTFLNARLATLYGIDGITGDEFRRVTLTGDRRGGLLTQAAILTLTSTPTRTSPVKRGKWILDNILNAPPPPPPPDVPPLVSDGKPLTGTMRKMMEKHRADANCAVCHDSIDPLGLALENYDGIGQWRDRDGDLAIDPAGTLKDGTPVSGPKQLRTILKSRAGDFRKCLAQKLTIYALGRGLIDTDKCTIDDFCKTLADNDDRFSSLVVAIVQSEPFQNRKGTGSVNP